MDRQGQDSKKAKALNLVLAEVTKLKSTLSGLLQSQALVRDGKDGRDGRVGDQGRRGEVGVQGDSGDDGLTGERGPKGEPGEQGPKGDIGSPGRDGRDGKNGNDGRDGKNGFKGDVGSVGPAGDDGKDGRDGNDGKNGNDGVSVTDVTLEDNVLFVWFDGVRRKIGKIVAPRAAMPFTPGGGGGRTVINETIIGGEGFTPWHILEGETVTVPTRREMALHGEFLNEGDLVLEGTARLRLEA